MDDPSPSRLPPITRLGVKTATTLTRQKCIFMTPNHPRVPTKKYLIREGSSPSPPVRPRHLPVLDQGYKIPSRITTLDASRTTKTQKIASHQFSLRRSPTSTNGAASTLPRIRITSSMEQWSSTGKQFANRNLGKTCLWHTRSTTEAPLKAPSTRMSTRGEPFTSTTTSSLCAVPYRWLRTSTPRNITSLTIPSRLEFGTRTLVTIRLSPLVPSIGGARRSSTGRSPPPLSFSPGRTRIAQKALATNPSRARV